MTGEVDRALYDRVMYDRVWQKTAELAGLAPKDLDPACTLESLGLDSSDAVVLAMELEDVTGRSIDVGIFLRFETIEEAAMEVARLVADGPEASGSTLPETSL
jgi:acyl carrier protein